MFPRAKLQTLDVLRARKEDEFLLVGMKVAALANSRPRAHPQCPKLVLACFLCLLGVQSVKVDVFLREGESPQVAWVTLRVTSTPRVLLQVAPVAG